MASFDSLKPQLMLAVVFMVLGFGFVIQLRSYEQLSERLETEAEADLVEIIDQSDNELRLLRGELMDEQLKLAEYKKSSGDTEAILKETVGEIAELNKFIGYEQASSEGIEITIQDKERLLTGFDIRQVVEELRASSAWAVAVNGYRIDNRSSFWRRSGSIFIDKRKAKPPYKIEAIGAAGLLYQTITLPRGIRDKLGTLEGVTVSVKREAQLTLPALEKEPQFKLSKPAAKS